MNYSELTTAIQETTENYDTTFISNIPRFIKAAERKIYNALKLPSVSSSAFSNCTVGSPYMTVPTDFLSSFEFAVVDGSNNWNYMQNKEVGYIREAYPNPATTGLPRFYALFDEDTFILGPTPDATYTTQLRYFIYPESIVDANTTWIGDKFENLLLQGALVEAAIFMKSPPDVLESYGKAFSYELELLKVYFGGEIPRDAFRGGQYMRR